MAERGLGCSEGDFDTLQILRNNLILEKVRLSDLKKQRGPLTSIGRRALQETVRGTEREIRLLQERVKKLERLCFGGNGA